MGIPAVPAFFAAGTAAAASAGRQVYAAGSGQHTGLCSVRECSIHTCLSKADRLKMAHSPDEIDHCRSSGLPPN